MALFAIPCDALFPTGFGTDGQKGISASKRPVLEKKR
jgi:hypothetical protein